MSKEKHSWGFKNTWADNNEFFCNLYSIDKTKTFESESPVLSSSYFVVSFGVVLVQVEDGGEVIKSFLVKAGDKFMIEKCERYKLSAVRDSDVYSAHFQK